MRIIGQLGFIFWVAAKDVHYTTRLVQLGGISAESNGLARALEAQYGAAGLSGLKIAALAVFLVAFLVCQARNRHWGRRLLLAGTALSVALSIWWDLALWTMPVA